MPSKMHDSWSSQFWVVSPARKALRLKMMVKIFNYKIYYTFACGWYSGADWCHDWPNSDTSAKTCIHTTFGSQIKKKTLASQKSKMAAIFQAERHLMTYKL